MRKLILWVPVLMVGSLMYWTIALNFGGMSLVALSSCVLPAEDLGLVVPSPRDSYQVISARRVSLLPEMDVKMDSDDVRAFVPDDEPVVVDIVSDRDGPRSDPRGTGGHHNDQGPGETAF